MNYISHVLHFPNSAPFDRVELRWPTFLGEFVRPIAEALPDTLYWFTYYGNHAKFRVYTDRYAAIRVTLESLRDKLQLLDKGEEKDLTLVGDLGHKRFVAPSTTSSPEKRAELILRSLNATANLVIDSIVKRSDGYWEFEQNEDVNQNPDKSHLFSVVHLFHNMCASDACLYMFKDGELDHVLSYYYFQNALEQKQINPTDVKPRRIKM